MGLVSPYAGYLLSPRPWGAPDASEGLARHETMTAGAVTQGPAALLPGRAALLPWPRLHDVSWPV
jgi:hypothetical protein